MIITVFGATGQVGKRVVAQALAMGFSVKAFGRNIENLIDKDLRNNNFEAIQGHLFDEHEVLNAIKGSDAVVSTLGGSFDGTDKTRSLGIKNIIKQMKEAHVSRIIALGGLGVLNAENGSYLLNDPSYPELYKAVGLEHLQAYLFLKESNLNFTFVCSPNIIDAEKSEHYITSADFLPSPNKGEINAGDIADFMLQELTQNKFIQHRVGISKL